MSLPIFRSKTNELDSVSSLEYCVACYVAWEVIVSKISEYEINVSLLQRKIFEDTNVLVLPEFIDTLITAMEENYIQENLDHPYGILCQDAFQYVSNLLISGDIKFDRPIKFKDSRTRAYYNKKISSFETPEETFAWKKRFLYGEETRGYKVLRCVDEIWVIKDTDEVSISKDHENDLCIYKKLEQDEKITFVPVLVLENTSSYYKCLKYISNSENN